MNQYFNDDKLLIFNEEERSTNVKTLFSRTEDYSLYKGLDRGTLKYYNYQYYANIYIRADTKKTEIKRKYEKLTEFYAGFSSLFVAIFNALSLLLAYINNFYAEHSIITSIFYFKDIENNNKFDAFKNNEIIKKIISLISISDEKNLKEFLETTDKENIKENIIISKPMKDLENNEMYAKYQINEDSSKKIEITKKETKRKISHRNKGKKNSLIIKNKSHIIQMNSFRNNLINKNSENILNIRVNNLI